MPLVLITRNALWFVIPAACMFILILSVVMSFVSHGRSRRPVPKSRQRD